jgi:hypothetical protein
MRRAMAIVPVTLAAAMMLACQSRPPTGSLAEIKREQEKRLFAECIAENRVLYRGNSNADYTSMRVGLVKVCRDDANARVW